jgi:hypothetical protein
MKIVNYGVRFVDKEKILIVNKLIEKADGENFAERLQKAREKMEGEEE